MTDRVERLAQSEARFRSANERVEAAAVRFEGLVNHQALGIHHVREGANETVFDVAFLVFGGLLAALGALLVRRSAGPSRPPSSAASGWPRRSARRPRREAPG